MTFITGGAEYIECPAVINFACRRAAVVIFKILIQVQRLAYVCLKKESKSDIFNFCIERCCSIKQKEML